VPACSPQHGCEPVPQVENKRPCLLGLDRERVTFNRTGISLIGQAPMPFATSLPSSDQGTAGLGDSFWRHETVMVRSCNRLWIEAHVHMVRGSETVMSLVPHRRSLPSVAQPIDCEWEVGSQVLLEFKDSTGLSRDFAGQVGAHAASLCCLNPPSHKLVRRW
jgi:hypothetical protein